MSKIKTPREKKDLSLKRDRRNAFGENSKASRKNIPRGKQRYGMNTRRRVRTILENVKNELSEDAISNAELLIKVETAHIKRQAFKKRPDKALGEIILEKRNNES